MIDPKDIDQDLLPIVVWEGFFRAPVPMALFGADRHQGGVRYRVVLVDEGEYGPACVVESEARDSLGASYWKDVSGDLAPMIRTVALMSVAAGGPLNEVRLKKPEPVVVEPEEPEVPPYDAFAAGYKAGIVSWQRPQGERVDPEPPAELSPIERTRWLSGHAKGLDDGIPF